MENPSIEIVHDEVEEAIEAGLLMDERHEVLPDGDWIRAARKWVGRDDLFVYFHRGTGAFVLASWLFKDPRVCIELETMDRPPDRGGWFSREFMISRCQPLVEQVKAIKRTMQRASAHKEAERMKNAHHKRDIVNHYRRRGMSDVAASVDSAPMWTGSGEQYEATKEKLNRMVRCA